MRTGMLSVSTLSLIFWAAGCGSGGLSEQDAQAAFAAMSKVATQGQTQAMANPNALTAAGTYEIDSSVSCSGGGSAGFSGDMELISGSAAGFDFDYTFAYTFEACTEGEYIMDGNMNIAGEATSTIDGTDITTSMIFSYSGTLEISGAATGSCDFDLTVTATSGPGSTMDMTMTGTICGMDAEEAGLS